MTAHLFEEGYESLGEMYAAHSMVFNLASHPNLQHINLDDDDDTEISLP